jgi:hypothetical protein
MCPVRQRELVGPQENPVYPEHQASGVQEPGQHLSCYLQVYSCTLHSWHTVSAYVPDIRPQMATSAQFPQAKWFPPPRLQVRNLTDLLITRQPGS